MYICQIKLNFAFIVFKLLTLITLWTHFHQFFFFYFRHLYTFVAQ